MPWRIMINESDLRIKFVKQSLWSKLYCDFINTQLYLIWSMWCCWQTTVGTVCSSSSWRDNYNALVSTDARQSFSHSFPLLGYFHSVLFSLFYTPVIVFANDCAKMVRNLNTITLTIQNNNLSYAIFIYWIYYVFYNSALHF